MRKGEHVPYDLAEWKLGCLGATISLRATHKAGFCHTDIRWSNILKFKGGYQLIDFDHAVRIGEKIQLTDGEQFKGRGVRLREYKLGDIVEWNVDDDIEMKLNTLYPNAWNERIR